MLFSIPAQIGYGALAALVFTESAGVPVPGETALLTAGVLAGAGHLALPVVIAVGAGAAVLGDNLGYWIGRRGGRALLLRAGRLADHRRRAVAKGDAFFARHGGKTVFLGRWVPGVRVVAAVLAGASAMPWRRFVVYNAAGALAWAGSVATLAAMFGLAGAGTWMTISLGAALLAGALTGLRARLRGRGRGTAATPPSARGGDVGLIQPAMTEFARGSDREPGGGAAPGLACGYGVGSANVPPKMSELPNVSGHCC
jgi:undecaprenyl-diphosphatase